MKNRILYFVSELRTFAGTGICRVTKEIFRSLSLMPFNDWEVIAVCEDVDGRLVRAHSFVSNLNPHREDKLSLLTIEPRASDIFLSVDLVYDMSNSFRNELARFQFAGVKCFFIFYDLIPLLYPDWYANEDNFFDGNSNFLEMFNFWAKSAIDNADGIICISKSVENELHEWILKHPTTRAIPLKIGYFHLGSNVEQVNLRQELPTNAATILSEINSSISFLMVGTLEPRKGHVIALDAFEKLWSVGCDVKLVIAGKRGWKVDAVIQRIEMHPQFGQKLIWLDGVNDTYLCEAYKSSTSLLALSEAEGFGLPLVEAMHFNLPIIARGIPVFREICSDNATYFTGKDSNELASFLQKWLEIYDATTLHTIPLVKPLSWNGSAEQLIRVVFDMTGNVIA